MSTIYTVVKGDTLSAIAKKYNTTVASLAALNNIKNTNYIVVGQSITISGDPATPSTNATSKAVIDVFGLQSDTDSTVYATWTWSKEHTESYEVYWEYDTGDGVWFIGSNTTVKDNQSTYSAPANAKGVRFKVKPISETYMVNNNETTYWSATWSTYSTYYFSNNPPSTPPVPTIEIENFKLITTLDGINDLNATSIQFQVIKDNSTVFKTSNTWIQTEFNYARYTCYIDAGSEYKVRARSCRGELYSAWSGYSSIVRTKPSASEGITVLRAISESSVYIDWGPVSNATSYEVEYTTKKDYFDSSTEVQSTTVTVNHAEITGLESGEEYFFRVRAVNDQGDSSWTDIKSIVIGKKPSAPTTWSSTTTVIVGEPLTLYWVHNSEDGSSQTYAYLHLIVDGVSTIEKIENKRSEEDKDKTSSYVINTYRYAEGTTIQWRVRTAGITGETGDWSVQRSIDIYAPPTLELNMTDANGSTIETLESFPFHISGIPGPIPEQKPIGYYISITSNEIYETIDNMGNAKTVNKDEVIFSKYYDISESLSVLLSASDLSLENNIRYTVTGTVSMNSGLTAESSINFAVAWEDLEYEPNAEISIDKNTFTASIHPYCMDANNLLLEDVLLSVYRREFNGTFTELIYDIDNTGDIFITDPHPALDYARYRIIAKSKTTGSISYYDVPGYPIGGIAAVIQWNEKWNSFDNSTEDALEQPVWSGSMLKLPYNIDVSDKHKSDVALVEYIGREHPVSYYGTQLGVTSTWSMEIPKSDRETLYTLRKLAIWMGDVYVREPSGSGYWANVTVSFSQKHCEVTIPITLDITRVSGGV